MYAGIKRALGPIPKKTGPLKEADGSIITVTNRKLERWVEHYTSIYSQPVNIEPEACVLMQKLPIWHELDALPSITEYDKCVKLKCGKSQRSLNWSALDLICIIYCAGAGRPVTFLRICAMLILSPYIKGKATVVTVTATEEYPF